MWQIIATCGQPQDFTFFTGREYSSQQIEEIFNRYLTCFNILWREDESEVKKETDRDADRQSPKGHSHSENKINY